MKPGFFDYFNGFMRWRKNNHHTNTMTALYMGLLDTFNDRGWEEWTSVNTPQLMILANVTSNATAFRARDELARAGLIEYKPGKKGKPSEYRLLCKGKRSKAGAESTALPKTEPKPKPEKAKPKPKKESLPASAEPSPPHDVQQQRFDMFWQQYPRKVGKIKALAAWKKLQPDAALYERILQAIERAKQSDQWQKDNGQFIPNPTTWLNRGGWDDELPQAPVAPANNMKGDITNGNYKTANGQPGGESGGKVDALGLPVL